jgi:ketosteroid isomerase-like protein
MSLSPADVQALRDITATHIRTGLEGNWAAWTDTCTDDVILIPPGDDHVQGRETARAWFGSFPRFVEFSGEPMVVRGSGDMAFTTGVAKAKLEVEGEIVDTSIKWLAVFERQDDGGWKMTADAWNE